MTDRELLQQALCGLKYYAALHPGAVTGDGLALIDALRARLAEPDDTVQVPATLYEAWRGMCFGVDWNKGTHAKIHRPVISRLMRAVDSAMPPSVSDFDMPDDTEARVQRIMEAADRFWAGYGDLKELTRAELERVVRGCVR